MEQPILEFIEQVANASTDFEECNSDLKRRYLIRNIEAFNKLVANISVSCGTFGTGYPFYVLQQDLTGKLPVIPEQIRYNNELIAHARNSNLSTWLCGDCLPENYNTMPDLKQICKPCPNMDKQLKPRKVINRLPDIDMWVICVDGHIEDMQHQLEALFSEYNIHSSDLDPLQTINDIQEIADTLKSGVMPKKFLPIDAHIIEYSEIKRLIEKVPFTLANAIQSNILPYLPIHPKSYRKTWQYDDEAYNYIYDFLSAFTEFNFNDSLSSSLAKSRKAIVKAYSPIELCTFLVQSATEGNKRRFKSPELIQAFIDRIRAWKTIQILDKAKSSQEQDTR